MLSALIVVERFNDFSKVLPCSKNISLLRLNLDLILNGCYRLLSFAYFQIFNEAIESMIAKIKKVIEAINNKTMNIISSKN